MKINKGDKFICTKNVTMHGTGVVSYKKGVTYISNRNNCLTDEQGDTDHSWHNEQLFNEHFKVYDSRVNHPLYYNKHPSGVECIDIIRHYCFDVGNAIKYLWRAGLKVEEGLTDKQKEIEDLNKAMWYIKDRIKQLEDESNKTK